MSMWKISVIVILVLTIIIIILSFSINEQYTNVNKHEYITTQQTEHAKKYDVISYLDGKLSMYEHFGEFDTKIKCDSTKNLHNYTRCMSGGKDYTDYNNSNDDKTMTRRNIIDDNFVYKIGSKWDEINGSVKQFSPFMDDKVFAQIKRFDTYNENINIFKWFMCLKYDNDELLPNLFVENQPLHEHSMKNYAKILNYILVGTAYHIKEHKLYNKRNAGNWWSENDALTRFTSGVNKLYFEDTGKYKSHNVVNDDGIIQNDKNNIWLNSIYKDETYTLKNITMKYNFFIDDPKASKIYMKQLHGYSTNVAKMIHELIPTYTPVNLFGEMIFLNPQEDYIWNLSYLAKHRYTGILVFVMGVYFMKGLYDMIKMGKGIYSSYLLTQAIFNNVISSNDYNALFYTKDIIGCYEKRKGVSNDSTIKIRNELFEKTKVKYNINNKNGNISIEQFFSTLHDIEKQKKILTNSNMFMDSNDATIYLQKILPLYCERYYNYFKAGILYCEKIGRLECPITECSDLKNCM